MISRLALAFFASGAAALLFQVLWFRALGRLLGNTVWAGALVLTAFMLGMAIGGLLVARWAHRIRRPARAFALAEATVALAGSLLVWGLPSIEAAVGAWLAPLAGQAAASSGLRLALALAALLVPTIAMGTTLALGVRMLAHDDTARALGRLYAANTLGACLAPLLAEYRLIGALGLQGTALVAAGLNLLAAALALRLPAANTLAAPDAAGRLPGRFLLAAALAGGIALALEVVWFRLLLLYVPGSDESFALMLAVVLLGIALGGAIAPRLGRLLPFAWIAAGSCLSVTAGYLLAGWSAGGQRPDLIQQALVLMFLPSLLSGALFTLLGAALRGDSPDPQRAIGALTTANTLGAALGAALAVVALLPRLGVEASLFALAAGYALLPLLLERSWKVALPLGAAALGLALFPFGRMAAHLDTASQPYRLIDNSKLVQVWQGPTTTLQLLGEERFGEIAAWRLVTDSYSMTGITAGALRYMRMFAWLPYALHPEPRRALLISYGAGNTAQALLSEPRLQRLTVVDLSPEMLAASPVIHGKRDPLLDSRVELVLEDGRHYLRTRPEQFDVITAEPPPPSMAGVVNLYTREYFMAVAERLAPGGLATYWLPVSQLRPAGAHAVVRAFCEAFPDCTLWAGGAHDWILMGGRGFTSRADPQHFTRLWREAAAPMIVADGLEQPAQLGAAFLGDAAQLRAWYGETPALTDDRPKRLAPAAENPMQGEYAAWLAPDGARQRFTESRWVAAHWPPLLARASLPFFAVQPTLNGEVAPGSPRAMEYLDAILRSSDLRIPVLRLAGSSIAEQEIVNRRLRDGGYRPEYAYTLGVRALAGRDYATAGRLLDDAAKQTPHPAAQLAELARCRARSRERPCPN